MKHLKLFINADSTVNLKTNILFFQILENLEVYMHTYTHVNIYIPGKYKESHESLPTTPETPV